MSNGLYMLCDARGLLVVDASQVFEDDFLERYGRLHPEIKLRQLNIGESDVIFEPLSPEEQQTFRQLEQDFTRGMPNRGSIAKAVRFKPESIPALSVLSAAAKSRQKLQQAGDNITLPQEVRNLVKDVLQGERSVPVTLYLNADNPTVQQLVKLPPSEDKLDACMALYNNSIMLINKILSADNAELMFRSFSRVIDRMITQTDRVQKLEQQVTRLKLQVAEKEQEFRAQVAALNQEQTEHVSCFFAMPFENYDMLEKAIRQVLEDKPYGWQVILARDIHHGRSIEENVRIHIARSHCYLAEISDGNPNVFLEIGKMSHYPERPLICLRRRGAERVAADLQGILYLEYEPTDNLDSLAEELREELRRRPEIQNLRQGRKTYLAKQILIREAQLQEQMAERLSQAYTTAEALCAADAETAAAQLKIKKSFVEAAQESVQEYFGLQHHG